MARLFTFCCLMLILVAEAIAITRSPNNFPVTNLQELEMKEEEKQCTLEFKEIRRLPGKCVMLLGNIPSCQNGKRLVPFSEECGYSP